MTGVRKWLVLCAMVMSAACRAEPKVSRSLSNEQVRSVLAQQGIGPIESYSQMFDAPNRFLLFVKLSRTDESSLCMREYRTLELEERESALRVANVESGRELSLVSCANSREENFANVQIGSSIGDIVRCAQGINEFLDVAPAKSIVVRFQTASLKSKLSQGLKGEMTSVAARKSGDICDAHFAVSNLMPQLLGIRITFSDGRPTDIYVNEENGVDVAY